jgi:hypothetical protein
MGIAKGIELMLEAHDEALVILAAIEGGITLGRAARDTEALAAVARRCRASLSASAT